MPGPREIVFMRHGESEANVVQRENLGDLSADDFDAVRRRADWQQRLSQQGIEQAKIAKEWVDRHLGGVASYEALYVSPFLRTRETASYVGGVDIEGWRQDNRIVERSWGIYGMVDRANQAELFPLTDELRQATPWYVRLDGGESMTDVLERFEYFKKSLNTYHEDERVFVVTHGDYIGAARYGLERMRPEQWEATLLDPEYKIRNCSLVQYTRVNPEDESDVRPSLHWRRMIYPDAVDQSPDGGRWIESPGKVLYSGADLLHQVEHAQPILPREDNHN